MKYWIDTEFIEDGKTIDLLSIGIISEAGHEFYAESSDADWTKASPWVKENVLPYLKQPRECMPRSAIAREILAFVEGTRGESNPEFWGYYADYDWVVLCQLFGTMMDLPKGWPMYCRDIKQLCDEQGNPPLPEQGKGEHHALADARWNRLAWMSLQ